MKDKNDSNDDTVSIPLSDQNEAPVDGWPCFGPGADQLF